MIPTPLSDLFDFPSINGLTEDFIRRNPGNIPVYGGGMYEEPIGYIADNIAGVKYFENCLAWNREGSVGYVFYHKTKFSTNDHQRPLILKDDYKQSLDYDYLRIVLEQLLLSQGFAWSKTASKEKVMEMSIDIPMNEENQIDFETQKDIVKRHSRISLTKKVLKSYLEKLSKAIVQISSDYSYKTLYLSDSIFKLSIGKRILKKDIVKEGIPVYSANPNSIFGYVNKSNLSNFDEDSIIWGIDGIFDFGYIPNNVCFATTDHCGRIQIKNNNILPEFVYYQLREARNTYGFNRVYRASLNNILTVSVNIPINKSTGEYDVDAQKILLDKYKRIETIRTTLIDSIGKIVDCPIDYD